MSEQKQKSWLRFFFKTAIILTITFTIIFTVLSFLGGNSDTLKGAIEDFAAQTSGHNAEVETLHNMNFYPYFSVDLEGLAIKTCAAGSDDLLRIETLQIAMSFWDMTFTTGNFKTLRLENITAAPGFLLPEDITIDRLVLRDPPEEKPSLQTAGKIGAAEFSGHIDMERRGANYGFGKSRAFNADLADMSLSGIFGETGRNTRQIQDLEFKKQALSVGGSLQSEVIETNKIQLTGDLILSRASQSISFGPDLLIDSTNMPVQVGGKILIANAQDKQILETALTSLYEELTAHLGYEDAQNLPVIWNVEFEAQ